MEKEGNLVIYDSFKKIAWNTFTEGKGNAPFRLELEEDGVLAVIDGNNNKTWTSNMPLPFPPCPYYSFHLPFIPDYPNLLPNPKDCIKQPLPYPYPTASIVQRALIPDGIVYEVIIHD